MTLGSLFDGSGTCPLVATMCGITPVWASEIEPFPIAVTKAHFPEMKHLGDITKINGAEIDPVDIITFGSPCQNLSISGNHQGLKGQESSLFLEAVRVIREMREATNGKYPRFAVWENVYGAFTSNKGTDFHTVLEKLWECCEESRIPRPEKWAHAGCILGVHSSIAWRGLDAQFWGVPQRRKRIFLVADFGGQCAPKILFERAGLQGDYRAFQTASQETPSDAAKSIRKYHLVEHNITDARYNLADGKPVQTLTQRMGTGGGNVPLICTAFSQQSFDQYDPTTASPTIKASFGNYGGGQRSPDT